MKLDEAFYRREDVVQISRELLGKVLCTRIDGVLAKAIVTETEAYAGVGDKASHAYNGKRTGRTEPMFASGGIAYVYLCYGIHHLFNVVTNIQGTPHAVLIRAGQPYHGIEAMLARRKKKRVERTLLQGPGSLAKGMGITTALTGHDLQSDELWIEDQQIIIPVADITVGPRVGVDYAEEDADLPYRFRTTFADMNL
jgi:DNA-3-methyladenine glycosylase